MKNEFGNEYTEETYKHCKHNNQEIRKRLLSMGVVQYVMQCLHCGVNTSIAIKKEKAIQGNNGKPPKLFNDELYNQWRIYHNIFLKKQDSESLSKRNEIKEQEKCKQDALKGEQEIESRLFCEKYNEYLCSDQWQMKRDKVLQRSGGMCEGCYNKKADHIHHLSYKHLYDELLFELVAVCRSCHEKIHPHMTDSNAR